jgi:threonine aldolase
LEDLQRIKQVCDANNLKFHFGARIWNALVAKQDPKAFGKLFDTISVCLSKG